MSEPGGHCCPIACRLVPIELTFIFPHLLQNLALHIHSITGCSTHNNEYRANHIVLLWPCKRLSLLLLAPIHTVFAILRCMKTCTLLLHLTAPAGSHRGKPISHRRPRLSFVRVKRSKTCCHWCLTDGIKTI